MCGTDVAYGAMRCAVPTWRMVLPAADVAAAAAAEAAGARRRRGRGIIIRRLLCRHALRPVLRCGMLLRGVWYPRVEYCCAMCGTEGWYAATRPRRDPPT
eukprot:1559490-Rhodomonas_salina.1